LTGKRQLKGINRKIKGNPREILKLKRNPNGKLKEIQERS